MADSKWQMADGRLVAAPVHVGCAFTLVDNAVYFGSGAMMWRYRLPEVERESGK
jgi:hypothetical protein